MATLDVARGHFKTQFRRCSVRQNADFRDDRPHSGECSYGFEMLSDSRFIHRPTHRRRKPMRCGRVSLRILVALVAIAGVAFIAWHYVPTSLTDNSPQNVLTNPVEVGRFVFEINERGEVESSSNVEIRCKVQSRNSAGTNILEIVPEGTRVSKDDFLVKLDDSTLQTELIQQQIVCSNSQSDFAEAGAAVEAAKLSLKEYEFGTFREQEEQLESELFVAEENVRRAAEFLYYSKRLAERGYVSEVQLEADRFAEEKARKELSVAKTRLEVLRTFARKKMMTVLQAELDTALARQTSRQKSLKLEQRREQAIEDQIAQCTVFAPVDGQVVYANDDDRRSSNGDVLIAEGKPVRERQVIIRLPDPTKMRVVAKIHESRINHIKEKMKSTIVLEALPDQVLTGRVSRVNEYPLRSQNFYMSHVKEYAAEIEIDVPPKTLRPGMTAQVSIVAEQIEEAIQVPIQAVFGREGRHFCVVASDEGFTTREVEVGPANEKFLMIQKGVQPGEQVVMAPMQYDGQIDLHADAQAVEIQQVNRSSEETDKRNEPKAKQPGKALTAKVPTHGLRDGKR